MIWLDILKRKWPRHQNDKIWFIVQTFEVLWSGPSLYAWKCKHQNCYFTVIAISQLSHESIRTEDNTVCFSLKIYQYITFNQCGWFFLIGQHIYTRKDLSKEPLSFLGGFIQTFWLCCFLLFSWQASLTISGSFWPPALYNEIRYHSNGCFLRMQFVACLLSLIISTPGRKDSADVKWRFCHWDLDINWHLDSSHLSILIDNDGQDISDIRN